MGLNTFLLDSSNLFQYIDRLKLCQQTSRYINKIVELDSAENNKLDFNFKYDFHIHSIYSDAIDTPEDIISYAKKIKLTKIAITDHNTIQGGVEGHKIDPDFVIIGSEIRTKGCEILALNITRDIEPYQSIEKTIAEIHSQGGYAIAAHPFDILRDNLDYVEKLYMFDAIELINGHTLIMSVPTIDLNKIRLVSFSDAHRIEDIGRSYVATDRMLNAHDLFFQDPEIRLKMCGGNITYLNFISLQIVKFLNRNRYIDCSWYRRFRRERVKAFLRRDRVS